MLNISLYPRTLLLDARLLQRFNGRQKL